MRVLTLLGVCACLTACSSHNQTPVMAQFQPQYCYQTTKIETKNGNEISSQDVTECSDNPNNKHFLAFSGMAKKCREHYYDVWYHGKKQKQRGFVCQKLDGTWEVINHPYN